MLSQTAIAWGTYIIGIGVNMNTPHVVIGVILIPMQLGGRFRYYGVAFVALYGVFNLRGKCAQVNIGDNANCHNG